MNVWQVGVVGNTVLWHKAEHGQQGDVPKETGQHTIR